MENLTFPAFEPADTPILESMILDMYACHDMVFPIENIQKTLQRAAAHPEQLQIKVFKVGKEIVGYAILPAFWSNEYGGLVMIIDELYVIPTYRSKGISTLFIASLEQSKDYVLLHLEVVKENTAALALYKRLGFQAIDRTFMKMPCNPLLP